ncbi:hypothetical protein [Breznakia pachnodae]|uniref:Uncharacterized protein n=1 Tax=Breznakia pachnodae TaxID=265178 RepID=A0ABU0E8E1_9FIRM|nr:hypothetical protein [Breznakia pachnodae]MDQ0363163.1 hypothetical protein [Breznakia pachnodae]
MKKTDNNLDELIRAIAAADGVTDEKEIALRKARFIQEEEEFVNRQRQIRAKAKTKTNHEDNKPSKNFEEYLYKKIINAFDQWDEKDIYSISFLVYSNGSHTYKKFSNLTIFDISCNLESYYNKEVNRLPAPSFMSLEAHLGEQRWNYAMLEQDTVEIINKDNFNILIDWYQKEGIENIGYEDYDNNLGPVGYRELLHAITNVTKRIQEEDYFFKKFNRRIPIIIQDLESTHAPISATQEANIHDEASEFLDYAKKYLYFPS